MVSTLAASHSHSHSALLEQRRRSVLADLTASALVSGVQQLAQCLPERRLLAAAKALGCLLYYVVRFRRAVVDARVAAAFDDGRATPEQQRRIARNVYIHLSLSLLWFLRLPTIDRARIAAELVDFDGSDIDAFREKVVAARRNAILLAGHVGMWEFLPAALADPQCEQWIVYRPLHQAALDRIVTSIRQEPQRHLVPDKNCFALLQRQLQSSSSTVAQLVGLVADQRATSSSAAGVTFLGQQTLLPTGAARLHLSSATSSSLWFGALLHNEAFYRSPASSSSKPFTLVLREISTPPADDPHLTDSPTKDTLQHLRASAITQSYAHLLEEVVLLHPEQYLWLHDLWNIKTLIRD